MTLQDIDTKVWTRFWSKVSRQNDCWLWTGSKDRKGYGFFRLKNKMVKAHRLSYLIYHGKEAMNLVCHKCDNPSCVNPKHLWDGTNQENIRDSSFKMRNRTSRNLGTKNPSSKISEDQVRSIRTKYSNGTSQTDLANEFCISTTQVWKIVHNKKWKHV